MDIVTKANVISNKAEQQFDSFRVKDDHKLKNKLSLIRRGPVDSKKQSKKF